jgi:Ca-activated chloride channel family protein
MAGVRRVTRDFIQRRRGDRVGAIVFGSQAYLQAPLTFDLDTVQQLLDETEVGLAGQKTAIGDAIGMAVRHLKDKHSGEKVVILLTDGSNTAGHVRPDDAARVAADTGIRIHTIAFGADQMIIQDPFWGRRQVNPSQDLDETLMKSIASLTGGRYFRAKNQDEIEEAFELIDRIEPVDRDEAYIRPQIERYAWPLAAALALSVVIVLGEWRRERGRSGLPTDKEAVS